MFREFQNYLNEANEQRKAETQAAELKEKELAALKEKHSAAVKAGDVEAVIRYNAEIPILEEEIKTLWDKASGSPFNKRKARVAWNCGVAEYNKNFDKKYEEYQRLTAQLCDKFLELVAMESEMLDTADQAYTITSGKQISKSFGSVVYDEMPMYELRQPSRMKRPKYMIDIVMNGSYATSEAAFFCMHKFFSSDFANAISNLSFRSYSVDRNAINAIRESLQERITGGKKKPE